MLSLEDYSFANYLKVSLSENTPSLENILQNYHLAGKIREVVFLFEKDSKT